MGEISLNLTNAVCLVLLCCWVLSRRAWLRCWVLLGLLSFVGSVVLFVGSVGFWRFVGFACWI